MGVVGSPVTASSYPTEDNSFILTDYHFRVSRLVRAASGFNPDSSLIVVTRPGGVIKVDGDEVSAGLSTEPPLKSGARYLLFLDSGGQPGEFSTRSTFGTYFLDGRNGFLGWRESGDIFFSDAAGTFQSISQLNCGWREQTRKGPGGRPPRRPTAPRARIPAHHGPRHAVSGTGASTIRSGTDGRGSAIRRQQGGSTGWQYSAGPRK
jgi:hypothetical protein